MRVPDLQLRAGLVESQLGLVLMAAPIGASLMFVLTAPMDRKVLLLLATLPGEEEDTGEVCSGARLDDGTFRRSHRDQGQVDPVAWCPRRPRGLRTSLKVATRPALSLAFSYA